VSFEEAMEHVVKGFEVAGVGRTILLGPEILIIADIV